MAEEGHVKTLTRQKNYLHALFVGKRDTGQLSAQMVLAKASRREHALYVEAQDTR